MPRDTLLDFFHDFAALNDEFLIYDDGFQARHYRYREIAERARAFAARLREAGIGPNEKVILHGEKRPEWVVALWGCLLEGVIAVPIDFRSSASVVERIAGIVSARALLIGESAQAPAGLACPVWPIRDVVAASAEEPAIFAPAPLDETAEILFTSGATGDPKGVTLTHRNILANLKPIDEGIEKYRKYMGPFAPIRFLNMLPQSHMFGQTMAAFIPPIIAGEVFFMSGYSPREVAHLIRRRRISVLVCVPQMLELLRDYVVHAVPEAN